MSTPDHRAVATERRSISRETMARISPLPPPEEVFVDWLLSVPRGFSIEAAARQQIALIDRRATLHPDVQCLRALLVAMTGDCELYRPRVGPAQPRSRRP